MISVKYKSVWKYRIVRLGLNCVDGLKTFFHSNVNTIIGKELWFPGNLTFADSYTTVDNLPLWMIFQKSYLWYLPDKRIQSDVCSEILTIAHRCFPTANSGFRYISWTGDITPPITSNPSRSWKSSRAISTKQNIFMNHTSFIFLIRTTWFCNVSNEIKYFINRYNESLVRLKSQ